MWSVVLTAATGIAWLFAARRLILLLDRIKTVRIASLPVSPFEHDGGAFLIGNHPLDLRMLDGRRFDLPEWIRLPALGRRTVIHPGTKPPPLAHSIRIQFHDGPNAVP
jgi:hypothetical protein